MRAPSLEDADWLAGPLYLLAAVLVLTPMFDFVTSGVVPPQAGNIEWRFATVGLLSGFLLTPMLGVALAMFVAALMEHHGVQKSLAILNLAVCGLFVVLLLFFLLDVVQLRSAVQAEAKAGFQAAAFKAVVKHLIFVVVTGYFGMRGLKAARQRRPETRKPQASIIIGS
jgi:hypothetical protein